MAVTELTGEGLRADTEVSEAVGQGPEWHTTVAESTERGVWTATEEGTPAKSAGLREPMIDSRGQSRSHTEFSAVSGVWAAGGARKMGRPTGQMSLVGDPRNRGHTTVAWSTVNCMGPAGASAVKAMQAIGREGPRRGESTPHITLTSTLIPGGAVAEATRATTVQGSGGTVPGEWVASEMVNAELPSSGVQEKPLSSAREPETKYGSHDRKVKSRGRVSERHGEDGPVALENKEYMMGEKARKSHQHIQGLAGMAGQQQDRQHRHGTEKSHNGKIMQAEYVGAETLTGAETQKGARNAVPRRAKSCSMERVAGGRQVFTEEDAGVSRTLESSGEQKRERLREGCVDDRGPAAEARGRQQVAQPQNHP